MHTSLQSKVLKEDKFGPNKTGFTFFLIKMVSLRTASELHYANTDVCIVLSVDSAKAYSHFIITSYLDGVIPNLIIIVRITYDRTMFISS